MLVTERLMLRPWWDDDWERMAAISGDPETMRYYPAPLTREESDRAMARMLVQMMQDGFGPFAVEAPRVSPLIGRVGARRVKTGLPCAPCVEVVWRIGKDWWGQGYATEAARAAISEVFEVHGVPEVVAVTAVQNKPSIRVMEKLGMVRDPDGDFDHPDVPDGHELKRHVLYRLKRPAGGVPVWSR
ncbi:MAG: GNAT family N-acetyltransferase [Alphaproteobacteria bacterium]|nr:GNAT family N-acetyltransferase [Alphaproteobacteria bacterium]